MKQEELMIGDWVLRNGEPYQIRQLGIFGVNRDGEDYPAVCVGKPKGIGLIIERNEIVPIPLTPEILKKNGFEECRIEEIEYYGWRLNENFSLERNAVDTLIWNDDVSIHSVHQLQHALRLCGINKEIKL